MTSFLSNAKHLCCFLPQGTAHPLAEKLHKTFQLCNFFYFYARGTGVLFPGKPFPFSQTKEAEVLHILAPTTEAEAIFEWIYRHGKLNQPNHGFLFMMGTKGSSFLKLPNINASKEKKEPHPKDKHEEKKHNKTQTK